ncbi:hypothetical protein N7448_006103 [Penicillium atrosanguineum]|uniref:Rhodopsin domain-containing protein n=1 Tax=Penicillium atrosanguineum TaxID=1132637 RepID=A0A9W9U294_9EURO|nr:uncharacterized protein N7443_009864 [Penicillium atrosanguineum]KAJ5131945.1 hypothetical protein N7448_006103 [Penicillium atrosanguineum]KAJ5289611.1 hypothetical protein N7443_009864 [Penicillium atrosanguineum]KAJ5307430.1 hypothetical protein N7476_008086 [Penicillium atrosanguineum]
MVVTYSISPAYIQGPLIAATVFGVLATLSTALRLYAMHLKGLKPGISEFFLLFGVLLMYGALSLLYIMTKYGGMGLHIEDLPRESIVIAMKSLLSIEFIYGTSLGLVKTSIALFMVRIFGTKDGFKTGVIVAMFVVWAWVTSIILEAFLLCRPFPYNWDTSVGGTCGNRPAAFMVAGIMNVVTDIMVIALPLPHVWKLKLNVQKKIGLTSVFGVGIVISVISIIRLISIYKLNFDDPTYTLLDPIMWTVLEPQLAIICANMPFFKTIIAAFAPAMGSSADRKYGPGVSSGRTFDRLGHSENNGTYSMDPLDTKTHTVNVGHSFDSSKTANADVESVSSEEQRLASNASPYGINVIQKFDVEYEKASVRG